MHASGRARRAVIRPGPPLPVGRVRDVVRAPAPVLSTPGEHLDPVAPETVALCADLVATMRISPGLVVTSVPRRSRSSSFCERGWYGCLVVNSMEIYVGDWITGRVGLVPARRRPPF